MSEAIHEQVPTIEIEKLPQCSFCEDGASAALTLVSNGNIIEKFFCLKHIYFLKYGKYKFDVSNEVVEDDSFPEEFEDMFAGKEESDSHLNMIINKNHSVEEEDDDDVDAKDKMKDLNIEIERLQKKKENLLLGLKEDMDELVKSEDFDKAAKIRDEIKLIEGNTNNESSSSL